MIKHYDINSTDNRDEALIARAVQYVKKPLWAYFRPMIRGTEHIPEGAGLYVGNHSGGIMTPDSFLFGCEVFEKRGLKDLPFGLTHVTAIKAPLVHQIIVGVVTAWKERADWRARCAPDCASARGRCAARCRWRTTAARAAARPSSSAPSACTCPRSSSRARGWSCATRRRALCCASTA